MDLRHRRRAVLPCEQLQGAHPLAHVAGGVVHGAVGLEDPRVDPEQRDAPGVGVGDGLEDEGGERGVRRDGSRVASALRTGSVPGTAPRSTGEGKRSTMSSSRGCTPTLRSDETGKTGKIRPAHDRVAQAPHELVVGQRALLEELLHQALVGLRHHLHELVAPAWAAAFASSGTSTAGTCRRRRRCRRRPGWRGGRPRPTKPFSSPRGMATGTTPRPKAFFQGLEGAGEGGAVAVHPVHHHDPGQRVLGGVAPDLLRLHLDPRHRVHHHQGRVGHPQGGPGLGAGSWRSRGRRAG